MWSSLTNENISVWIRHAFDISASTLCAWVMWWPTPSGVTFEVVISAAAGNIHSNTIWPYRVRHYTRTSVRNQFNQFTSDWSRLLLHQATRTFLACDPVVDVALDQGFLTSAAPQGEVHGFIMRLTQWYCCGHSNGSGTSWPRWTRGDSISPTLETWVICESVTPN